MTELAPADVQTVIPAASIPMWWDRMDQGGWMASAACEADPAEAFPAHRAHTEVCRRPEGHTGRHLALGYAPEPEDARLADREVLLVWGERHVTRQQLAGALGRAMDAAVLHGTTPEAATCEERHPVTGERCWRVPGHAEYSLTHFGPSALSWYVTP